MDEFLDAYDLLKLNQDDINNLNRSLTRSGTEAEIKNFPTKEA